MSQSGNPIAETQPWLATGQGKRDAVRTIFAGLASRYDLLNGVMSMGMHHRWRKAAVRSLGLAPGSKVVDLCCGTGDFFGPIRAQLGPTGTLIGIDFCRPMLEICSKKQKTFAASSLIALGDGGRIPVASNSVDAVTVGWGIRNVPNIDQTHAEIARVLRPGGRFVSIDMAQPRSPVVRRLSNGLFRTLVPLLGKLFGRAEAYTYLPESSLRFWSREKLQLSMEEAGFTEVKTHDFMFGNICMHSGTVDKSGVETGVSR